jgi:hypothetical protein
MFKDLKRMVLFDRVIVSHGQSDAMVRGTGVLVVNMHFNRNFDFTFSS